MIDAPFRIVFFVGFLAVVLVTLYHRMRSWASREKLDRWQEGPFLLVTLRVSGLVLWLAVIAYRVNPAWMAWSSTPSGRDAPVNRNDPHVAVRRVVFGVRDGHREGDERPVG
jgi:hypothetical protein